MLSGREFARSSVPLPSWDSEDLLVILRVFVEARIGFDSSTHVLVLDEVREFIRPSIWVVILANMCLGVAVLVGGGCSCDIVSSGGRRLHDCVMWLVHWGSAVVIPCAPFGSSIPSALAVVPLIARFNLVVIVLMCGGCSGGGGLSEDF